tara:strand:+ start:2340 stop:2603 length:264 start_codon:yes stop_codon:yes gene_type:complete
MTPKEQIIQSIVKLNSSAKPSWLDKFSIEELSKYYKRLFTYLIEEWVKTEHVRQNEELVQESDGDDINCPPVRTASTKPEPTGEYIL